VLLRLRPGEPWPLLLAAVRDEFAGRAWKPPAAHWPGRPAVQGGIDLVAGGTWLAVDRAAGVVAALLNGVRRPPPGHGVRPTRGTLALAALDPGSDGGPVPGIADPTALAEYDGFHLLRADRAGAQIWSWDGTELAQGWLPQGDTIVVNLGANRADDPLVPHFAPLFAALPAVAPTPGLDTAAAWDGWLELLRGAGLALTDPRALIIEHHVNGQIYGSTSASLIGVRADGVTRYDFTATPATPHWYEIAAPA
jgi:uncharacterized protein with NRDE domain